MFGSIGHMADICLVPQMYNAVRFKCDLEPFPTLRAINTLPQRAGCLRQCDARGSAGRALAV